MNLYKKIVMSGKWKLCQQKLKVVDKRKKVAREQPNRFYVTWQRKFQKDETTTNYKGTM